MTALRRWRSSTRPAAPGALHGWHYSGRLPHAHAHAAPRDSAPVPLLTPLRHAASASAGTPQRPCRAAAAASPSTRASTNPTSTASGGRTDPLRVCVVGAGVVGLTTALRLLQLNSEPSSSSHGSTHAPPRPLDVTVVAAAFTADTTSAGAAGLWGPYKLSSTPDEDVRRWGAATYDHLMGLVHSGEAAAAGVALCSANSFYSAPQELPFWRSAVYQFQLHDNRMLDGVRRSGAAAAPGGGASTPPPHPIAWGYHWLSLTCEGSMYLPWLTARMQALGGRLLERRLGSLGELSGFDAVVNATGLAARELVGDAQVYPIRGQIRRVRAPWVTQAYFYDDFYIIPNRHFVVLGGTGQVGDSTLAASAADRDRILAGCTALLPSLAAAEPLGDWVGLRPGRSALRLEAEAGGLRLADGRTAALVHNYGHGGSGLTLAWGCAGDAVQLVRQATGV